MATPGSGPAGAGPSEVTGLVTAQRYAAGMSSAYAGIASQTAQFAVGLGDQGVDGPAVVAVTRAQELTQAAGVAWADANTALERQSVVKEAYAAVPDAGGKGFLTGSAGPAPSHSDGIPHAPGQTAGQHTAAATRPSTGKGTMTDDPEGASPGQHDALDEDLEIDDVLGVAGTPRYGEIIGSDQVRGQGKVPANVLLADWDAQQSDAQQSDAQPGEPVGKFVVLETPAPDERDPTGAPMSPAEAGEFADKLDDLAGKAERGERPPRPSKYARSAQRIEDDINAGRAKATDKVGWGDDDEELPLTNKDLLDLLRRADPEGTKDNGTRTHVVCRAAIDAGSDEYASWAQITPDGRVAVTAIEGLGGSSNPDDEFWQERTSVHTPDSARRLADKLRTFAEAAAPTETMPPAGGEPSQAGPTDAPVPGPRRVRNSRGEEIEYDPDTGAACVIQADGWRATVRPSSSTGIAARLLYWNAEIKDGRGDDATAETGRALLDRLSVAELREVADETGTPTRGARTRAQLIDTIVTMTITSARKYRGLRQW